MATRLKAVLPLTLSIGLLAFLASEVALNFTFHWVTVQDGVFGKYGLPQGTHLVLPALFVAWGLYFLLGADRPALGKTMIAALTGTIGATIAMVDGAAVRRVAGLLGPGALDRDHRRGADRALHGGRGRPLRAGARVLLLRRRVLLVDRDRARQLRPRRQGAAHAPRR